MLITPKSPNQIDLRTPKKRGRPRKNDPAKIASHTEKGKGDIEDRGKRVLPHTLNLFAPRKVYPDEEKAVCIESVLSLIQDGYTIPEIAKAANMPEGLLIHWMNRDTNGCRSAYMCAREARADRIAREIMEIADRTDTRNPAEVNKARLQTDVRRWYLSHILPEKYGDLQRLELTGKNGGPVAVASVGAVAIAEAQQLRALIFGTSQPEPEAIEAEADDVP